MIRTAGVQFFKINSHSNFTFQNVRKICVNSCVQLNRSKAEEVADKKRKELDEKNKRWTKLYHFKDMKYHSIVTRLKIYPYLTTIFVSPIAYLVELTQQFPEFSATPCLVIGNYCLKLSPSSKIRLDIFHLHRDFISFLDCFSFFIGLTGSAILSAYSKALANTIGIVYICGQNKNLQIAYIDFWGKQHFIEATVDEVSKWNKSKVKFGLYKTVQAIDGKEQKSLKLPWNGTDVFDIKLFRRLFGK